MKAGFFRKLYIMADMIISILYISFSTLFHRHTIEESAKLTRWLGHRAMHAISADYTVLDPHHLQFEKNRAYIVMSNHASLLDIPAIFAAFPNGLRMIAKKELFKIPIWGQAMKKAGFIAIDRKNRHQAIEDLKRAKQIMLEGVLLWIAPEGTRSRTGQLLPFKKGGFLLAKQTDAIIIPVGIYGTYEALAPDTFDFNLKQRIAIYIDKPIDTRNYADVDQKKLIEDVRNSIQQGILIGGKGN